MASVKVAVRVRPFNQREENLGSRFIINMQGKKTSITNVKLQNSRSIGDKSREIVKDFTFDHSYWTVRKTDPHYASQQQVFKDLGRDVVQSAYEGYNACVFAYGQTGSGKTYTMMGNQGDQGLIPRICEELFARMRDDKTTYRTEVSYLEIYNERVRDLVRVGSGAKTEHTLRVREHPKEGPYVQDLSKHIVMNYGDIEELMVRGNTNRTTASTNMNDVSSRSHAIFTIVFTQAKFSKDAPSETHSKIHLVDLAGSERADATGATGQRLKEGGSINKSLVTLGNVISTLADMSEKGSSRKMVFIPYRDSVLTWLLKDSLGGNAKTMMIATISPACVNYAETLSTLRYANRAKNIINKPTINEDPNVKLIRELREEIRRLRAMLGGNIDNITSPRVQEKLHENEARVKVLTEEWAGKWKETANILQEQQNLALRKEGLGVVLDSELPHLIGIDDDILSTGIMLYHLKNGRTTIGSKDAKEKQDIVLSGQDLQPQHCIIDHQEDGNVVLIPINGSTCVVNGTASTEADPTTLTQGAVILLGKTNMFRFNHPAQAAKLREELKGSTLSLHRISSLSQSMSDLAKSTENLAFFGCGMDFDQRHREELEQLEVRRQKIEEMEEKHRQAEEKRLAEQGEKEKHLEEQRCLLERMNDEAERRRKDAEEVQEAVKKEAEELRIRSLNLEKQYQQYMEERTKFLQEQKDHKAQVNKDKGSQQEEQEKFAAEKQKIRQAIETELKQLADQEKLQLEARQRMREQLEQEIEVLKARRAAETAQMEEQRKSLERRQHQHVMAMDEAEKELDKKRDTLKWQKEEDLKMIEKERKLLEDLKNNHQLAYKFTSELEASARERLQMECVRIDKLRGEIETKDKTSYKEYKKAEMAIEEKKKETEKEIKEGRQQLEADRVYLQECEERYRHASENATYATEAERNQLEKERIAIESEQQRIQEEEARLDKKEKDLKVTVETDLKALMEKRSGELDELNQEKGKLKQAEKEYTDYLDAEIAKRLDKASQAQKQLETGQKLLQDLEEKDNVARAKLEDEILGMETEREYLCEVGQNHQREADAALEKLEAKLTKLEQDHEKDKKRITSRRKRLQEMESLSDEELMEKRQQFEAYRTKTEGVERTQVEGELLEQQQHLLEMEEALGVAHAEGEMDWQNKQDELVQERSRLESRAKELQLLEGKVHSMENELDEARKKFEQERQQELDNIDMEKYKLQELENQERINALVEQEVKRRLFEERVQREKQRRMEREKQRKEREEELSKIKQAHNKELQRLKQRYEAKQIGESVATRANPYASIMTGDYLGSTHVTTGRSRSQSNGETQEHPVDRTIKVSIPSYTLRGSGIDTHYEFEVKVNVMTDSWSIFRRYSRFRDLHNELKSKYREVAILSFPPKRWFGNRSEKVVTERRKQLEEYLKQVMEILQRKPESPLHLSKFKVPSKTHVCETLPFFKKGVFESTKHGTG